MLGMLAGLFYSPLGIVDLALLGFCVYHAIKNGNVWPWIYVLVLLPGLGVLIYFLIEILPGLSRSRTAQRMKRSAAYAIDPNKDYRVAMREVEMVGSADAKRAFAEQLIQRGQYADAIEMYQNALQGQFATDTALLLGLARAQFAERRWRGRANISRHAAGRRSEISVRGGAPALRARARIARQER